MEVSVVHFEDFRFFQVPGRRTNERQAAKRGGRAGSKPHLVRGVLRTGPPPPGLVRNGFFFERAPL